MSLLDAALEAHGGEARFDAAREISAETRVGGLAWPLRGMRTPFEVRATVGAHAPAVRLHGFPAVDLTEWPGFGRRWDRSRQGWFCGMAIWNYLTTPWLLRRCDVRERSNRRLEVRFPPEVPTHSPIQTFHFDAEGLLTRLDYTALAFGRWARTTHGCRDHAEFDGLRFPTRRRAVPRGLRGPTLVSIEISSVSVR